MIRRVLGSFFFSFPGKELLQVENPPLSGFPLLVRGKKPHGTHYFYPSASQAKYLLPLEKQRSKIGLSFFIPLRPRIFLYIKWFMNNLLPQNSNTFTSETEVMSEIKNFIGNEKLLAVVRIGTPGPHAKDTVLFLNQNHEPAAIGKIGMTEAAKDLLKNEAKWLQVLSQKESLVNHCPKLIAFKRFSNAQVVIQSVGVGVFSGYDLSVAHIQFLSLFHDVFPAGDRYTGSLIQQEMTRRFVSLKRKLSQTWVRRVQNSLDLLAIELENTSMPFVAAHRDFVPWNMRMIQGRNFVFDWEYACHEYFPLYDIFHFLLMPHILKRNVSAIELNSIIQKGKACGELLAGGADKVRRPDFQLLAYMLDLCLMYLESRNGKDAGFPVLYRYGNLIDAFETWRVK